MPLIFLLQEAAQQQAAQPGAAQLLVIVLGLLSILGTFATVVAMFVSLKGKVENQNTQIAELHAEVAAIKKSLETLIRLEERVESMRVRK